MSGIDAAATILAALKTEDAGRADLVIAAERPRRTGSAARPPAAGGPTGQLRGRPAVRPPWTW